MTLQNCMRIRFHPFHAALASALITCSLLMMATAWAKSASEVFDTAAPSIVVVHAQDSKGKSVSLGSGVVIAPGVVTTNCHVIEKAEHYAIKQGEKQFTARLKHADWSRDVCSLMVQGLNAPASILGSTKHLKVGQRVYAIGAPKGLELTLSEGILSSLRYMDGGKYLQVTAPISPGSSGGGLFDEEGRLIGLPTFYLSEGQQLNFAVPVEWIQALPQRVEQGQVRGQSADQWLAKAIFLESKEDWQGLLKHTRSWTQTQPRHTDAWVSLGIAYGHTGQMAKKIEALQQALRIDPDHVRAWSNLGIAYDETDQPKKAIEALQQALRIDPEDVDVWNYLGVVYHHTGQMTKWIEAHQQALRIDPDHVLAWRSLAFAYGETGQLTKEIEALQQVLRIDPEDADAWVHLGLVYGRTGQRVKNIEALQQALRIDPEHVIAWQSLVFAYGETDQPKKKIEALQQLLRISPEDVDAWFLLGFTYFETGQRGQLTAIYQRLRKLDSKKADEFFRLLILP